MSNFFRELCRAESIIIGRGYADVGGEVEAYSADTVLTLKKLISVISSGSIVVGSQSDRFICKHFRIDSIEMSKRWRLEYKAEKSPNTFRCQISNLSSRMYSVWGADIFELFYCQDTKALSRIRAKILAFSFEDVTFSDVFYREIEDTIDDFADSVADSIEKFPIEDCVAELKLLYLLQRSRFTEKLCEKSPEKLRFILNVMNTPLVYGKDMKVNTDKIRILKTLKLMADE